MSRSRRSSRTASGWPRSARWPPGSRTSSTTRRRRPAARPAQMAEALDVHRRDDRAASSSPGVEREEAEELVALQREALERRRRARPRSTRSTPPTPRTSCSTRLEELGVAEPWRLAEPLAAAGVDEDWLDARRGARPGRRPTPRSAGSPRRSPRAAWPPSCRSRRGGCPSLVGAVKTYAYMDRGELVEVDLHEGLETTLVVLGHKLKHTVDRGRARLRPRRCPS